MHRICRLDIACLAVIVASVLLLATHLAADAPIHISANPGVHFDPPSKCHNARNYVLFGRWVTDDWLPCLHSPLYTLLQAFILRFIGVGLAQIRVLSVLCSALTLTVMWLVLRREDASGAALLALVLCSSSLVFQVYGRSGLLEPLEIATIFVCGWLVSEAARAYASGNVRQGHAGAIAASLFAWLALLSKPLAAPALLAVPLTLVLLVPSPRNKVSAVGLSLLAIAGVALAYWLFYFRPHLSLFQREWSHVVGHSLRPRYPLVEAWFYQPILVAMPHTRPLIIAGLLGAVAVLVNGGASSAGPRRAASFFYAMMFLLLSQVLGFAWYRPERYYYPLLPLAAVLAAAGYARIRDAVLHESLLPRVFSSRIVAYWIVVGYLLFLLEHRYWRSQHTPWPAALGLSLISAIALVSLFSLAAGWLWPVVMRHRRQALILLNIAMVLAVSAYSYDNLDRTWRWKHHPHYSMRDFSRRLGTFLGDAVILGESPLFAVIENRHRALKVTHYGTNREYIDRVPPTHILTKLHHSDLWRCRGRVRVLLKEAVLLDKPVVAGLPFAFYATHLEPLQAGIIIDRHRGAVRLELRNPDRHTAQVADYIVLQSNGATDPAADGICLEVPPGARRQADFALVAPEAEVKAYLIRPLEWTPAESRLCQAQGTKRVWEDCLAAGNLARTFVRPGKIQRDPVHGTISLTRPVSTAGLVLAGARLRGSLTSGDQVVLTLETDGGRILRRSILSRDLSARQYTPVVLATVLDRPANVKVTLSFKGTGRLFADGLLVSEAAELASHSIKVTEEPYAEGAD